MTDPLFPQGSVIITPTKMYEEMQDISKKVDHLTSVVDPAIANLRQDVAANASQISAHDTSINSIQNQLAWLKGIGSVVALLVSSGVVTSIVALIHK